jgi:hypothetical protein
LDGNLLDPSNFDDVDMVEDAFDMITPWLSVYTMDCPECSMDALSGKDGRFPKRAMDKCVRKIQQSECKPTRDDNFMGRADVDDDPEALGTTPKDIMTYDCKACKYDISVKHPARAWKKCMKEIRKGRCVPKADSQVHDEKRHVNVAHTSCPDAPTTTVTVCTTPIVTDSCTMMAAQPQPTDEPEHKPESKSEQMSEQQSGSPSQPMPYPQPETSGEHAPVHVTQPAAMHPEMTDSPSTSQVGPMAPPAAPTTAANKPLSNAEAPKSPHSVNNLGDALSSYISMLTDDKPNTRLTSDAEMSHGTATSEGPAKSKTAVPYSYALNRTATYAKSSASGYATGTYQQTATESAMSGGVQKTVGVGASLFVLMAFMA